MENILGCYINEEINVLRELDLNAIGMIFSAVKTAYENGGRIYIMGNGGSSANASHWVNDIKKNIRRVNNGFDVISLTDNVPLFTAYSNDVSYEDAFFEMVKADVREEDILLGLSVSGNSKNIVNAFKYGQANGCKTISIIADYNGELEDCSDICVVLNTKNYGIAEDVQQTINHMIVQVIKSQIELMVGEA